MSYQSLQSRLPAWLRRHVLHFDETIKEQVQRFAAGLPDSVWLLDAGAGECQYAQFFSRQRLSLIHI